MHQWRAGIVQSAANTTRRVRLNLRRGRKMAEPDMTRVDKGYGEAQGPPEGFAIGIRAGMPAAPIVQLDAYQRWLLSR